MARRDTDNITTDVINKGGRPKKTPEEIQKMLDEVFTKIQPYLQLGYSFHKACLYAQIPYTTYKPYYDEDEVFRNKIERERTLTNMVARKNLVNAIKEGDLKSSLEWLQAHEKEDWSKRQEVQDVTPRENKTVLLLQEIIETGETHENDNRDIQDKKPTGDSQ